MSYHYRPHPVRGVPGQVQLGEGYTPVRPGWGYPCRGVPHLGYPSSDLAGGPPAGGYPTLGTPHQTWMGGSPARGSPTLGTPPLDLARGGTPAGRGYPRWSTWYGAIGMPLAFTQEDLLVVRYGPVRSRMFLMKTNRNRKYLEKALMCVHNVRSEGSGGDIDKSQSLTININ